MLKAKNIKLEKNDADKNKLITVKLSSKNSIPSKLNQKNNFIALLKHFQIAFNYLTPLKTF